MEYGANLLVNAAATNPTLFDGIISLANPLELGLAEQKFANSWWASRLCLDDILAGLQKHSETKSAKTLTETHKVHERS